MSVADWDITVHARPGARFATPDECRQHKDEYLPTGGLVEWVLTDALVAAADEHGVLTDFDVRHFYATHVQYALAVDDDPEDEPPALTYDRFTAMALQDGLKTLLLDRGLLAHRGKGDSYDYRLALPE
ncbi:hypothetical protein [Saccharopolyspora hattusasensis]|uniref:hypothetical protein n=1 Tax=Saccharopolyspora hattusasensis TaxID=1128679 RepID=UPI003D98FF2E